MLKKNGIQTSKLISAAVITVKITGNSFANALDTAGGTPAGILIANLSPFDRKQYSSVIIRPKTIAVISPLAPNQYIPDSHVPEIIMFVTAKNDASDVSPAITGALLPLEEARK